MTFFTTHGKFSSQLDKTFILAWNDKIKIKELRDILQNREQVLGRSYNVPNPIELLVLSACETAVGDKRAALGLAGVAVRSGARSTIASLWQVDDNSTTVLMGGISQKPQHYQSRSFTTRATICIRTERPSILLGAIRFSR